MKNTVICFILFCFFFQVWAQKPKDKHRLYKLWVELKDQEDVKGYLIHCKDSAIVIVEQIGGKQRELSVASIDELKFRRKGKIGRGIGIGAGAGLALGVIVGYASGDDEPGWFSYTAEEKSAASGVLLLPIGAGVGALIGSGRTKYRIDCELNKYSNYRMELNKYISFRDNTDD